MKTRKEPTFIRCPCFGDWMTSVFSGVTGHVVQPSPGSMSDLVRLQVSAEGHVLAYSPAALRPSYQDEIEWWPLSGGAEWRK